MRISYKSGAMQSLQAASYFNDAVGTMVEGWLERTEERLYAIDTEEGGEVQLRIWSSMDIGAEDLHRLMVWLTIVQEDLERAHEIGSEAGRLEQLVKNWLAVRHDAADLFIEQATLKPGATVALAQLSMLILGGRTVMVSSDSLMFTRLHEGVFGLTLAGRGSYLLEDVHTGNMGEEGLRRAS